MPLKWGLLNFLGIVLCIIYNNIIEVLVEDSGLEIRNITTIPADASNIYFYLTGDQCAITNIRIIDD